MDRTQIEQRLTHLESTVSVIRKQIQELRRLVQQTPYDRVPTFVDPVPVREPEWWEDYSGLGG